MDKLLETENDITVIGDSEIFPDEWIKKVFDDEAGAVSTFIGTSRKSNAGRTVSYLDYEAYLPMAQLQMQKLCTMLRNEFPDILKTVMIHRLGKVGLQEISILIAVSSPRRDQAIRACQRAIDLFKEIVPIWKREFDSNGNPLWLANDISK